MSKQIDWSKAPEGCIGAFTSKYDFRSVGFGSFFVITKRYSDYGAQAGCSGEDQDGKEYHVFEEYWDYHEKPASWSGEGLPPVGVVCGKCYNSPGEYYNVKVLAHDDHYGDVVIYRWIEGPLEGELDQSTMHLNMASGSNAHWSFRPIRAHEQIAADERQKMVDMLWQRYLQPILAPAQEAQVKTALGLIYDDFYRKP